MAAIATEMGLSRKTVSAVLNGHARKIRVSEATILRVQEHLARRGYVPSRKARLLQAAPARVVGLLYPEGIYSHLIDAFHKLSLGLAAIAPDVEIRVAPPDGLEEAVRELLARRVTDLVWIQHPSVGEAYREERIANYLRHMRTVIYNYRFDSSSSERELIDRGLALVGVDRHVQIRRVGHFLKRLGHRVIALPKEKLSFHPYAAVLESVGLEVVACPLPFHAGTFIRSMSRQGVTAACFFYGDSLACQAIAALNKRGVRVPEDLTVIGFDGTSVPFCRNLTTLAMPVGGMVARTCQILSGQAEGLRHCFGMKFVKGGTHEAPRSPITVFTKQGKLE